jgi:anti-sigma regulatory factor (Ser/Thr protein kinase)
MALRADVVSARLARERVMDLIGSVASPEQCGIIALIVSELVTNAVLHGREPIRLHVQIDTEVLRLGVSDGASTGAAVAPRPCSTEEDGGRGLQIVETLALRWGVTANDHGKTVWATISLDPT